MSHKLVLRLLLVVFVTVMFFNVIALFKPASLLRFENNQTVRLFLLPSISVNKLIFWIGDTIDKLGQMKNAVEELHAVRKENELLLTENMLLKTKVVANERVTELEKHAKSYPFKVEITRVVGRNPFFWHQYLILEGGQDRGFEPGMPVITREGLVGKITDVYASYCRVLLIIDPEFSVDVRGMRSGILALCSGIGTSLMKINYVPKFEDLVVSEVLATSGLDGAFPEGIQVGYVAEINKPFSGFFLEAHIIPVVDTLRIREVMVVKSFKKKK